MDNIVTVTLQVCHCISCRKTGGVCCVNLAAQKDSLQVEGRDAVKSFRQLPTSSNHDYTEECVVACYTSKFSVMPDMTVHAVWFLQGKHRDSH